MGLLLRVTVCVRALGHDNSLQTDAPDTFVEAGLKPQLSDLFSEGGKSSV